MWRCCTRQTVFGTDVRRRLRGYFAPGVASSMLTMEEDDSTAVTSLTGTDTLETAVEDDE